MARYRNRGMALRPVQRIKHVVDLQGALVAGTQVNEVVVQTVDTGTLADVNGVQTGSTVNGIYLHVEAVPTSSAALSNIYMIVYKNPGDNITPPSANAVGADDDKRFVIHQEMVMLEGQANGNPRTVFNGVIVIPKGYKRFGPNDTLIVALKTPGIGANYCMQVHYKEFR